ncbi:MAG TPA: hypothetical protein VE570_00190 [Thermoleophilaceae bacterium]|nr:hypothetical protein [Thermoleophilaceae bacterium]
MTKRLIAVAACVAAFVTAATVADAASKHAVSGTLNARVLTSSQSEIVYTGIITGKGLGEGAAIVRVTPAQAANTFNSSGTAYFKRGTLTFKGTNTSTVDPATNNATFAGTIKAVSGTGALKGVKGTINLTGSSLGSDPTYGTFTLKGSLKY